ncbi:MAG: dephospho-CoA kinase [Cellulophaga sp.]
MMIIGLTGGIGSGKSTVAKMFRDLGVPVYNSDKEAKKLMKSSKKIKKAIIELLGRDAYSDGKLNKSYISNKIFNNSMLLDGVNKIVHPAVRKHFFKWANKKDSSYVIQETALIFENKAQELYDRIILVTAPESVRIQRVVSRDAVSEVVIQSRIKNQLADVEKQKQSDYIIDNLILEETELIVKKLHFAFVKEFE